MDVRPLPAATRPTFFLPSLAVFPLVSCFLAILFIYIQYLRSLVFECGQESINGNFSTIDCRLLKVRLCSPLLMRNFPPKLWIKVIIPRLSLVH